MSVNFIEKFLLTMFVISQLLCIVLYYRHQYFSCFVCIIIIIIDVYYFAYCTKKITVLFCLLYIPLILLLHLFFRDEWRENVNLTGCPTLTVTERSGGRCLLPS